MKKIFTVMAAVLVVFSLCGNVFAVGSEIDDGIYDIDLPGYGSLMELAHALEKNQFDIAVLGSLKYKGTYYLASYDLWCKWNDDPSSMIALPDTMTAESVTYIPYRGEEGGAPAQTIYAALSMETRDYWYHFCFDKDFGASVLEQAKAQSDVSMLVNGHPVYSYCETVVINPWYPTVSSSHISRGYYWEQNGYVMKIITIGEEEPDDDMFAKCNAVFYTIPEFIEAFAEETVEVSVPLEGKICGEM